MAIKGLVRDGAERMRLSRLRMYCSKAIVSPIAVSPIHNWGLPGRKNNTVDMFQLAISQGW